MCTLLICPALCSPQTPNMFGSSVIKVLVERLSQFSCNAIVEIRNRLHIQTDVLKSAPMWPLNGISMKLISAKSLANFNLEIDLNRRCSATLINVYNRLIDRILTKSLFRKCTRISETTTQFQFFLWFFVPKLANALTV